MALGSPKKQPSPYRRKSSSPCWACPSHIWRVRQLNFIIPVCQRRFTATGLSSPVTQWLNWGLNWGCLAPEPVPLTISVYLLISSGSPGVIPRPTVVAGAPSIALNSAKQLTPTSSVAFEVSDVKSGTALSFTSFYGACQGDGST